MEQVQHFGRHHNHAVGQRDADREPAQFHARAAVGDFFRRLCRFFKCAFFRHLVRDVEAAVGMVFFVYRPHQQVADQAENQKSGHDVHGDAVCLCRRHAAVDLSLPDVVHQHGAEHGGGRPGQEDAAMDGADFQRAEQVFDVYRHGGKPSAVH